jgi:hypothetical protein
MKPVSLFGSGVDSYSKAVTAQRRLNCFYDSRPDSDKSPIVVRGTPGSSLWITLPTFPVRGMYVQNNYLYAVAGKVLYKITPAGAITSIGTLTTSTGYVSFADNNVQLLLVDGTNGYIYTLITGSYAQSALNTAGSFGTITDANFPAGATSAAFIDGRFLTNLGASRQCYGSYTYDGTNWGATSPASVLYFTKENSSDLLLKVNVFEGTIALWGGSSIEFWQDVGGATMPYQRVTGSTSIYGLAAVLSVAIAGGVELFLANSPSNGVQICALTGYQPAVVSTPDIDHIINSFTTISDAVAFNYLVDGHDMYQLTFPTAGRSFLYDTNMRIWSEAQTGTVPYTRHIANYSVDFGQSLVFSDATTGLMYTQNQNAYTDNGAIIMRQVVSKHICNAGNIFAISELYLDMDTGEGLQSGQGSQPQIMLETSKDMGRTYGQPRSIDIGAVGQYKVRAIARRFGQARDFVFRITMTDPVPFIIIASGATMIGQEGAT